MSERVLICTGTRKEAQELRTAVDLCLSRILPDRIIVGDCTGVDRYVREWAMGNDIVHEVYPAQWSNLGKAAGPIRNEAMGARGADYLRARRDYVLLLHFPGGHGTHGMIRIAKRLGIPTIGDDAVANPLFALPYPWDGAAYLKGIPEEWHGNL